MRVAWQFNSYQWPVNPETDTGFVSEEVLPEVVPIRATKSSVQWGGRKSARRQITGWLYGLKALEQYNTMRGWKENRTRASLVDHFGNTTTARLVKFDAKFVQSNTEWGAGRPTWQYTAEFMEDV